MDFVGLFAISLIVGLVVGVLSGLLGIGGGTLMLPIFRLGYGLSPTVATASSLFTIIPTAISGSITHIKGRTCLPKLGIAAGIGGACFSPLGVWLNNVSPDWLIMLCAAIVIAYSAGSMLSKGLKAPKKSLQGTQKGSTKASSKTEDPELVVPHLGKKELGIGFVIGLAAGLASGYVGVGGGFLMIPLMVSLLHAPMKLVSGTSLIAIMILAVPGVVYQIVLGNVYWLGSLALAIGTVPGALIGARLTKRVPERNLKLLFGALLLVVAVMLVVNQWL